MSRTINFRSGTIFAVLAVSLGCAPAAVERPEPVRPVKTMVVASGGDVRTRIFPGVAEASRRVELAFQVPGLLVKLPVKEGQRVAKGDVIGELRKEEFEARLTALHPYELPEFVVLSVDGGNERYLEWVRLGVADKDR